MVGAMSLLASLFGAGKSGSAPPGPVSSVARSDGSKRSGGSAAVNAVDLGEMRAKAATDKLRVVNEAIAEHDTYLATLAIYERLITVYRAKKAGLEALAAARGAMRDAVDAVTTPRAGNTETNGANEEKGTGTRYEVSPEELLEQLGPEPKPPAQRSPVNEPRIAADGTEGPPIFLLACAALEGSADALRIVPELLKRGADANARGTRHDHGADVPALCLVVGAMEGAAKIVAASVAEEEDVDVVNAADDVVNAADVVGRRRGSSSDANAPGFRGRPRGLRHRPPRRARLGRGRGGETREGARERQERRPQRAVPGTRPVRRTGRLGGNRALPGDVRRDGERARRGSEERGRGGSRRRAAHGFGRGRQRDRRSARVAGAVRREAHARLDLPSRAGADGFADGPSRVRILSRGHRVAGVRADPRERLRSRRRGHVLAQAGCG